MPKYSFAVAMAKLLPTPKANGPKPYLPAPVIAPALFPACPPVIPRFKPLAIIRVIPTVGLTSGRLRERSRLPLARRPAPDHGIDQPTAALTFR